MVVGILVLIATAALKVVRQALRLKRRSAELRDSQLFIALTNAQGETLHLQRSITMLASQLDACKSALDAIRLSVSQMRGLQLGSQCMRVKMEFRELLNVLR